MCVLTHLRDIVSHKLVCSVCARARPGRKSAACCMSRPCVSHLWLDLWHCQYALSCSATRLGWLCLSKRGQTRCARVCRPRPCCPLKTGVEGEVVRCAPRAVVSWCRGQVRWEKLSDARHVYRCCSPATPCTMVRSAASLLVRAAQRFGYPVSRLGHTHKPISHLHDDSVPWTVGRSMSRFTYTLQVHLHVYI